MTGPACPGADETEPGPWETVPEPEPEPGPWLTTGELPELPGPSGVGLPELPEPPGEGAEEVPDPGEGALPGLSAPVLPGPPEEEELPGDGVCEDTGPWLAVVAGWVSGALVWVTPGPPWMPSTIAASVEGSAAGVSSSEVGTVGVVSS